MNTILEVNHVSKTYPKFKLDDVSFNVELGRIVGFIGRNGAGKTTTLKGIMNLLHFDSSEVLFMGKDMKTYEKEAKQEIGFALSELNYYPNKTIKQINDVVKKFYPGYSEARFEKLVELFNLDVKKKLQELSSGMKVKFSLALALSHDAKLLILDEPTSGLDPISRDEILDIFKTLVKTGERSIIFSTHITSDLDKCADDIVYIKEGVKAFEGTKASFIESYRMVHGNESEFSMVEPYALSEKKEDGKFQALIKTSNISKIENVPGLEIKEPDLEEIMVSLERGKKHEEFIF